MKLTQRIKVLEEINEKLQSDVAKVMSAKEYNPSQDIDGLRFFYSEGGDNQASNSAGAQAKMDDHKRPHRGVEMPGDSEIEIVLPTNKEKGDI